VTGLAACAHEPYDVLLVAKDGSTTVFAHHGG
jgi:hypothetical protein